MKDNIIRAKRILSEALKNYSFMGNKKQSNLSCGFIDGSNNSKVWFESMLTDGRKGKEYEFTISELKLVDFLDSLDECKRIVN